MNRTGDGHDLGQEVVMLVLGGLVSRSGVGSTQRIVCTFASRRDHFSRHVTENLM